MARLGRGEIGSQRADGIVLQAALAECGQDECHRASLLCVTETYKVASGNLSLPGVIMKKK